MTGRPMLGLAAVWLAGLFFANRMPVAGPICFMIYDTILFYFFVSISKKQPGRLNSYVLPKRYLQTTLYFILLPSLFFAGFFCMRRTMEQEAVSAASWRALEEAGETAVTVYGTVKEKRYEDNVILVLEECETEPEMCTVGNCQVTVDGEGTLWLPEVQIGNRIRVYGKFSVFRPASNPGQFDACSYYAGKGLFASVKAMKIQILSEDIHFLGRSIFLLRQRLRQSLLSLYPEEKAGVLAAMILGDKDLLPEEVKELYQQNGISHILAISGLHISLLCMGLFRGLRKLGCSLRPAAGCSACFLVFYLVFTGGSTSSLRAGVMCLVMLGGMLLRRSYDLLSALGLAAILVTALHPMELFSAGFLLSFGAVIGIAVSSEVMKKRKEKQERKKEQLEGCGKSECFVTMFFGKACDLVLPGMFLQCVTLPVSLWFFYEFSPYSIVLNLLVLPLVSLVLVGGIISMLLGIVSPLLGPMAAGGVYVLLEFYEQLGLWTQKLPFSFALVGKPQVWQLVLYYGLLGVGVWLICHTNGARTKDVKRGIDKCGRMVWPGVCIFLSIVLLFLPLPPRPELLFLDVSQGDSALIFTKEGKVILSDCGSSDVSSIGEYRLSPVLKEQGVSIIDMVIVSHMDSDHISGIQEILEEMSMWKGKFSHLASYDGSIAVRELVLPRVQNPSETYLALVHSAEQKQVAVRYIEAGEELYREQGLLLECLWPYSAGESENDTSLVCFLQTEHLVVWFMGDAGVEPEQKMLERLQRLGLDAKRMAEQTAGKLVVLKVGHHGSKTSSGESFIRFVSPDVAIISCGYKNRYGHPHASVLQLLEKQGSVVYRTDEVGAVSFELEETLKNCFAK